MKPHQKHTKLARVETGAFGKGEWAVHGAPCAVIEALMQQLAEELSADCRVASIDASHAENTLAAKFPPVQFTQHEAHFSINLQAKNAFFEQKSLLNTCDLLLINGNHFAGKKQMVILDPVKFDSLERKKDRLTDVRLFLRCATTPTTLPDWISAIEAPVLALEDTTGIARFMREKAGIPDIAGLILTGGKSERMGQDKAWMEYHQMPQWEYAAQQVRDMGMVPFVSCRPSQVQQFPETTALITDTFSGLGPMGGLLSAFREHPDKAFLVLACDLPLLNTEAIKTLLAARRSASLATAFRSSDGWPEPLIAIWEPKAYPVLLQALGQGISCVRKVLINSDTILIDAPDNGVLKNVNTPEEAAAVR